MFNVNWQTSPYLLSYLLIQTSSDSETIISKVVISWSRGKELSWNKWFSLEVTTTDYMVPLNRVVTWKSNFYLPFKANASNTRDTWRIRLWGYREFINILHKVSGVCHLLNTIVDVWKHSSLRNIGIRKSDKRISSRDFFILYCPPNVVSFCGIYF